MHVFHHVFLTSVSLLAVASLVACKDKTELKKPDSSQAYKGYSSVEKEITGDFSLTQKIHQKISQTGDVSVEEMKTYTFTPIKDRAVSLKMVALSGGEFLLGSPEGEVGRSDDEGPQRKVRVDPFWICEIEVPWAVYRAFYENGHARHRDGSLKVVPREAALADLVSQPTPQIHDMFSSGQHSGADDFPAMDMTHHAASKFCEWISAQTGQFYRLPTEAEWEYACRAGSRSAYYFGEDVSALDQHAWFAENANFSCQKVASKRPNAFGLYDMLGNVAEWTLDQYAVDTYAQLEEGELNPWREPKTRYPRVFRGGSWNDEADRLRCAARGKSEPWLKTQDPQTPKSIWYHTDAQFIGFRIVRPLKTPSAEVMHRCWNSDGWGDERNAEDL